ncbi:hypothetical protein, partial [Shewanella sp. GXUN23E]|uniref:hypothetical protein n=1 Tax=Shewanella sp. GXUN23E TaxID=3422498 RepID=UPI003D7EB26C
IGTYRGRITSFVKGCDIDLYPYMDSYDIDGDGEVDRCYNPADKIKQRVKVPTACEFDAYLPSTDDENAIKTATSKALELLESMEAVLRNPSAANGCQLNGLATLMGMPDYTHPHFVQLSGSILSRIDVIKPKLQSAASDLSGDPKIRYLVADGVAAIRNGDFVGIHCKSSDSGVADILYNEREISYPYYPANFEANSRDLRDTIIHETYHDVGGRHPDNMELNDRQKKFEKAIANYNALRMQDPSINPALMFERMTKDPFNLMWMMEAVKCI